MNILVLSDKESPFLWDYYQPGKLKDYDLILSCGDLDANYLSFLVTMTNVPLLYVHGNHDTRYAKKPPEGCVCIEDTIYNYKGLKILGLGGSILYSGGPHQYTEKEMARRIRKLKLKLMLSGGVDIVLTHSPAAGYGDANDNAHKGFQCFVDLIDKYKPKYFIHGHVHMNYGRNVARELQRNDTTIVNAYERYTFNIDNM